MKRLPLLVLLIGVIIGIALLKPKVMEAYYSEFSQLSSKYPPKEAKFYTSLEDNLVRCRLCFRRCLIPEGKRGFCKVRENRKGILYSLVYNFASAIQLDPIEKEPCFHFLPSTKILCFGTAGCNFRCRHCHNWHLSQRRPEDLMAFYLPPEEAVELALRYKVTTLSFTYNEPTVFYEYIYDIAKLAKEKGLRIIWHTNGTLNFQPLRELLKFTDAVVVDLKGFTQKAYDNSSAKLEPVLETLRVIKEEGVWLEIVNLIVPTMNDSPSDIKKMCEWIKNNLGEDVPLHFSRFFPSYKLTSLYPTPVETLERAYRIAKEVGLNYVTLGNLPGHKYNSTFCPKCGRILIKRIHFQVLENNLIKGRCKFCGEKIPGVWE